MESIKIHAIRVSIIDIDLWIPEIEGIWRFEWVRARKTFSNIPILPENV